MHGIFIHEYYTIYSHMNNIYVGSIRYCVLGSVNSPILYPDWACPSVIYLLGFSIYRCLHASLYVSFWSRSFIAITILSIVTLKASTVEVLYRALLRRESIESFSIFWLIPVFDFSVSIFLINLFEDLNDQRVFQLINWYHSRRLCNSYTSLLWKKWLRFIPHSLIFIESSLHNWLSH